jgi:hypothetical protein
LAIDTVSLLGWLIGSCGISNAPVAFAESVTAGITKRY